MHGSLVADAEELSEWCEQAQVGRRAVPLSIRPCLTEIVLSAWHDFYTPGGTCSIGI